MTSIGPIITPGGEKLTRSELSAWISVCIYRRVPEEKYAPYLTQMPSIFIQLIQEFIYKYSPITFDADEKDYFHRFINVLLDKYLGKYDNLKKRFEFTRFLNDVRFGYVNESVFEERIEQVHDLKSSNKIEMFAPAASKASNKKLVKMAKKHTEFNIRTLESLVKDKSPPSFKVWFDLLEDVSFDFMDFDINFYVSEEIILKSNNFKITKATPGHIVAVFEVQTPDDFVKLGFASKYEIFLLDHYIAKFIQ